MNASNQQNVTYLTTYGKAQGLCNGKTIHHVVGAKALDNACIATPDIYAWFSMLFEINTQTFHLHFRRAPSMASLVDMSSKRY